MSHKTLRRRDLLIATGVIIMLPRNAFALPTGGRRLTLKNAHTGESFDGPYRDESGLLPDAVEDLAVFLRDFHVDKTGPVDIGMLDFLADVMVATNQTSATVLSAFRTRETNEKLRATSFGVAEKSQHLVGRAIDVTFDRNLGDVERAALGLRRGGVGWYPSSHFIHLDSGPIRSWQLDGEHFDRLLLGPGTSGDIMAVSEKLQHLHAWELDDEHFNRLLLGPAQPGHVVTVRERLLRLRAIAERAAMLRGR